MSKYLILITTQASTDVMALLISTMIYGIGKILIQNMASLPAWGKDDD